MSNHENLVTHLLSARPISSIVPSSELHGFSGFHGGLSLSLLGKAMTDLAPELDLVSITGTLHRPIRGSAPLTVSAQLVRQGRTATTCEAQAGAAGDVFVSASAVLTPASASVIEPVLPPAPTAPNPLDCDVFTVPVEFVPITAHTEIRPVGPDRPYAGGSEPALTAWMRLAGQEEHPDPNQVIFLMDALAPSYAAVLHDLTPIPTVELTVNLTQPSRTTWTLLEARTVVARPDGWLLEQINAWDESGRHIAMASQTRKVMVHRKD